MHLVCKSGNCDPAHDKANMIQIWEPNETRGLQGIQSCSSPSAALGHPGFSSCDLYLQNQWLFGHSAFPYLAE